MRVPLRTARFNVTQSVPIVFHEQDFPARFAPLLSARSLHAVPPLRRSRICRKALRHAAEPQTSLQYPY
jgi:hypothetical protein